MFLELFIYKDVRPWFAHQNRLDLSPLADLRAARWTPAPVVGGRVQTREKNVCHAGGRAPHPRLILPCASHLSADPQEPGGVESRELRRAEGLKPYRGKELRH